MSKFTRETHYALAEDLLMRADAEAANQEYEHVTAYAVLAQAHIAAAGYMADFILGSDQDSSGEISR